MVQKICVALKAKFGCLLRIDDITIQCNRGQFARVKVMVEKKQEVLEKVRYAYEHGRLCEQDVHYE